MNDYTLYGGDHDEGDGRRCAMEWVAFLAGEEHTDHPRCVDPVLAEFCRELNDTFWDEDRQRLRPYLVRTIGTRGDGHSVERERLIQEYDDSWTQNDVETAFAVLESLLPPLEEVEIPANCAVDLDEFAKV